MTIPQSQLETWSHPGATLKSASTYQSIKTALENYKFLPNIYFEDYLQGSYPSGTNTHGNSDIDVVVELYSIFKPNTQLLTEEQERFVLNKFFQATHSLDNFKKEVVVALQNYFGKSKVNIKSKAIKILPDESGNRLPIDVLVCQEYRLYKSIDSFDKGIEFYTNGSFVRNFPKQHIANGRIKNKYERTNGNFNGTVRMFKNARNYLIKNNLIDKKLAPSYFIECLLYNAPDNVFYGNWSEIYYNTLNWLCNLNQLENLLCQNEITKIFNQDLTSWNSDSFHKLLKNYIELWTGWNSWNKEKEAPNFL